MSSNCLRAIACQLTTNYVRKFLKICGMKRCKYAKLVALLSSSSIVLIALIAYVSPVELNTTNPKLSVWEIALLVGGGMKFKDAMSPHTHAGANENKLEKVGPTFLSSVGDFGRLFLSV